MDIRQLIFGTISVSLAFCKTLCDSFRDSKATETVREEEKETGRKSHAESESELIFSGFAAAQTSSREGSVCQDRFELHISSSTSMSSQFAECFANSLEKST